MIQLNMPWKFGFPLVLYPNKAKNVRRNQPPLTNEELRKATVIKILGKILEPQISLSTKDNETFALSF